MKNLVPLLFILSFKLCFGQSETNSNKKLTPNPTIKYTNIIKYDSIEKKTTLSLFTNFELVVADEWFDFNYSNNYYEIIVGHCPAFINKNGVILEPNIIVINDDDKPKYGIYDMYDYNKLILRRLKKEKGILVTTIYNKEKKYHLHTIKVYSRNNKNELITTYQLIGEKGKKIYRFAIYNADDAFQEKINDFLAETFNNN